LALVAGASKFLLRDAPAVRNWTSADEIEQIKHRLRRYA
jgi:hypothetical protein